MKVHRNVVGPALAAAMTVWIVVSVAVSGQQPPQPPAQPPAGGGQGQGQGRGGQGRGGGPPGGGGAAAAPAPKPAIPAAASSIAEKPDMFYGQNVTVYAAVEKTLTSLAFTLDQDKTKSTGKEVIVLAPRLHEKVEPNTYVTVIGEVVKPDAAEIAKRAKAGAAGLPADVLAQNPGKPVILATAVITPALADIAKFIPPPMTPEEEALDKTMKGVGQANGALRKGIDASSVDLVKSNTAILAKAFADTEAFWKKRGKEEAVKIAQTARAAVDGIDKAVAAGNWNDAKTHNTTLGQQCQSCHGTFRERLEDGSFAVKKDPGQ
jgi:cytochrome c556